MFLNLFYGTIVMWNAKHPLTPTFARSPALLYVYEGLWRQVVRVQLARKDEHVCQIKLRILKTREPRAMRCKTGS